MAEEKKNSFSDIVKNIGTTITTAVSAVGNFMSGDILGGIDNIQSLGENISSMPRDPSYVGPTGPDRFGISLNIPTNNDNFNNSTSYVDNDPRNQAANAVLTISEGVVSSSSSSSGKNESSYNAGYLRNSNGIVVGVNRVGRGLANNDYTYNTDKLIVSQ